MSLVRAPALVLLASTFAIAQVPPHLGYQGRLLSAAGQPVTGLTTVRFGVFTAQAPGGSELWSEQQTLGLSDGYYSAFLGDASDGGVPASVFDGAERFLEVTVNGSTLAPRQRIDSVAYAFSSLNARNVTGGTVNASSVSINGTTVIDSNGKLVAAAGYTAGPGLSIDSATSTIRVSECLAGQTLVATDAGWSCGLAGITSVTAANGSAITVTNSTTAPVISIAAATDSSKGVVQFGVDAGTAAQGNDPRFGQLQGNPVLATVPTLGQTLTWNGSAWAPASPVMPSLGQVQLSLSGAVLALLPHDGNLLTIGGVARTVPNVGVTLGVSGLSPNTTYFIYAFMSGSTMQLEASTTTHARDAATGLEVRQGDASRTLVGMARTIAGPAWVDAPGQRFVRSYFHRSTQPSQALFAANRATTSGTSVELNSEIRNNFLLWADESASVMFSGSQFTGASSGGTYYSIALDTSAPGGIGYTAGNNTVGGNEQPAMVARIYSGISEGVHFTTVVGFVSGSSTLTFAANSILTTTIVR